MHVPLDIHYCDIDQQHHSLGLYRRYTLSCWSIHSRHIIHNFNITGEWKYAYFVLLSFINIIVNVFIREKLRTVLFIRIFVKYFFRFAQIVYPDFSLYQSLLQSEVTKNCFAIKIDRVNRI